MHGKDLLSRLTGRALKDVGRRNVTSRTGRDPAGRFHPAGAPANFPISAPANFPISAAANFPVSAPATAG
jgi:hypothetical protein